MAPSNNADNAEGVPSKQATSTQAPANCGDHPCDNFDKQAAAERYAYNKGVDFWTWLNSDETRANMNHYWDVSKKEGKSIMDALDAAFTKWQQEQHPAPTDKK